MAGVDVQARTADVFARLKSHSAGTAVRAALGNGANSVIPAEDLKAKPPPATPFLALRGGPVAGAGIEMRIPIWTWYLYDDVQAGYWRVNGLIPLIEQAYPPQAVPYGRIQVVAIGGETSDPALNGLLVRTVQLAYYTRG